MRYGANIGTPYKKQGNKVEEKPKEPTIIKTKPLAVKMVIKEEEK